MTMQTQCPYCKTIFRLTQAHLNIAQGHVRCSRCRSVFNARQQLIQDASTSPEFTLDADDESTQIDNEFNEDEVPELLKADIEEQAKRGRWKRLFFLNIIALLLVAVLALQYLWFNQKELFLQNPQVRPWLDRFCYTFLCTLPVTRDLTAFQVQNQVVRPHPDPKQKKVLQIEALFSNTAFFSQPYPDVLLTFKNAQGEVTGKRRFTPQEYLEPDAVGKLMPPNGQVHLRFTLTDMPDVVGEDGTIDGHEFEFL